jgi:acetyl esterase/lipase
MRGKLALPGVAGLGVLAVVLYQFGRPALTFLTIVVVHFIPAFPLMNNMAPFSGVTVTLDLHYDAGPRQTLDIYAPRHAAGAAPVEVPVVVYVYGGAWYTGGKASYPFVGATLADRGVLVVVPEYRLHPEVDFQTATEDVALAVVWIYRNIARFGGDPRRIFVMGQSSGAQLAALLALDPDYLRTAGQPDMALCGFIGLGGSYDLLPSESTAPDAKRLSNPINFVSRRAPPALLLAGTWDGTTYPGETPAGIGATLRLAAALNGAGASASAILYPDIGHQGILLAFSRPFAFLAPAREDVMRFIASHTCGDPQPQRQPK